MSILEDYWKIAKKEIDTFEAKLEKLKVAEISGIKKEILVDFIEIKKNYLKKNIILSSDFNDHTLYCELYFLGEKFFYNSNDREIYLIKSYSVNGGYELVNFYNLTDELIKEMLGFINEQLNSHIDEPEE